MTTDHLAALLEPIENRLKAASKGPWELLGGGEWISPIGIAIASDDGGVGPQDADFIVNAPTDQGRLLAAVQAVSALHKPDAGHNPLCECSIPSGAGASCEECQDTWPCPTVVALITALEKTQVKEREDLSNVAFGGFSAHTG